LTAPTLWHLKREDVSNGCCGVKLHHSLFEFACVFDVLTKDNERNLKLNERFSAMFLAYSSMICGDNDNGIVVYSGIFQRLNDLSYVAIYTAKVS